jgi:molecular chaperone DnaK (HSP70)
VSDQQLGIFGIDLGTTYSVVAYIDETGRPAVTRNSDGDDTTPSVVYFETEDNVVVGKAAKASAGVDPDNVVSLIKRQMHNKDYTRYFWGKEHSPSSISALILAELARSAEETTHRTVRQVVITVPAYFGLLEKDATKKAGEIAGLEVIGIVPEPVAAALAYGVTGSADGTTFLVYDLGGGTFDITLIKMTDTSVEVLAVDGDHNLGGADWDDRLFEYLKEQTVAQTGFEDIDEDEGALQDLRRMAEETKQALSKAESKTVAHRLAGKPAKIVVSRAQFQEMTADLLEKTAEITGRMLAGAEQRFGGIKGQISELLLVGGSSWMPAVAERLRAEFPWEPKVADPDLAVAKGAALYAAGQTVKLIEAEAAAQDGGQRDASAADGGRPGALPSGPPSEAAIAAVTERTGMDADQVADVVRTVVNVLPKAVGVKLVDTDVPGWDKLPDSSLPFYIEHLVPAQTQLPFDADKFVAGTLYPNQQSISIEIWEQEGAVPDGALGSNHRVDNAGLIEGLGPFKLEVGSPIEITVRVDAEGTVNLLAVEPRSGKELTMSVKIAIMSDEKVQEYKATVSALTKKR